jgi:ABC-type glutathione transport system ATPase component
MNMNAHNAIAVSVKDLEKKFGAFTAVDRINFEVKKGEIFGFLGPNGAGKSTTLRMLCGILSPTSGTGQVGGYDINLQQELIKENIGYMSQRFSLYEDLTAEENIDFYSGIYKVPRTERKKRRHPVCSMSHFALLILPLWMSSRITLNAAGIPCTLACMGTALLMRSASSADWKSRVIVRSSQPNSFAKSSYVGLMVKGSAQRSAI